MNSQVAISSTRFDDDTGLIVPPPPGLVQTGKDWFYWLRMACDARLGRIDTAAEELAATIDWYDWQPDRPTVLCFSRATFDKDVEEMRRRTNLNFAALKTTFVKRIQESWIPPEWRVQTYFTELLNGELVSFKPYLVKFGCALLRAASKTHPIDVMLAANSDYWQDESLRLAGREIGIPFVALCRENYTIPHDQRTVLKRYAAGRFRYSGTGVAVYSKPTKEVMDGSGCFEADSIAVTGAPRFDRWRDVEALPLDQRDCLTLISFASPLYYAPIAYSEVERVVGEAHVEARSQVRIILKIKKQNETEDNRLASPTLEKTGMEIIADWSLFNLLPRSRAVIGYNSMAVAEGLLTSLPVIIPNWGDAIQRGKSMFDPTCALDRACIYFPENPGEMKELARRALTADLPVLGTITERRQCFSRVIEAPTDTTSSALVEAFIRRFLKKSGDLNELLPNAQPSWRTYRS